MLFNIKVFSKVLEYSFEIFQQTNKLLKRILNGPMLALWVYNIKATIWFPVILIRAKLTD